MSVAWEKESGTDNIRPVNSSTGHPSGLYITNGSDMTLKFLGVSGDIAQEPGLVYDRIAPPAGAGSTLQTNSSTTIMDPYTSQGRNIVSGPWTPHDGVTSTEPALTTLPWQQGQGFHLTAQLLYAGAFAGIVQVELINPIYEAQ